MFDTPQELFTYMISYSFTVNGKHGIARRILDVSREIIEENDLYAIEDSLKEGDKDCTELFIISYSRIQHSPKELQPSNPDTHTNNKCGGFYWTPQSGGRNND